MFGISQSEVSNIVVTWITLMYRELVSVNWWSSRDDVMRTMPDVFRMHYPHTSCIIDATELWTETPSNRAVQSATFSSYKHHNTFKALVCISPSGAVIFVSSLFSGCISDPDLVQKSGSLDKVEPGDHVMADRGFTILDALTARGAHCGRLDSTLSNVLIYCASTVFVVLVE